MLRGDGTANGTAAHTRAAAFLQPCSVLPTSERVEKELCGLARMHRLLKRIEGGIAPPPTPPPPTRVVDLPHGAATPPHCLAFSPSVLPAADSQ